HDLDVDAVLFEEAFLLRDPEGRDARVGERDAHRDLRLRRAIGCEYADGKNPYSQYRRTHEKSAHQAHISSRVLRSHSPRVSERGKVRMAIKRLSRHSDIKEV